MQHVYHPTFPESAGGNAAQRAANTTKLLQSWNVALQALHGKVPGDVATPLALYGAAFAPGDKVSIPPVDLPAGTPSWMYDDDGWARRVGANAKAKRGNITITAPASALP